MPRNMSFILTTQQIEDRTKTVTRRLGWANLEPGDIIQAVEKGMGLKKGEKVKKICLIQIISNTREQLNMITKEECIKEGFPNFEPDDFIHMFCNHNKCTPFTYVNRIEFKYIEA